MIGLGYVGLPLSIRAAQAGFTVSGIDVSTERVEELLAGRSPFTDVTDEELSAEVNAGRFRPTGSTAPLAGADVIVICVPTPLKHDRPDMSFIEAAGSDVASTLQRDQLVILESTTFPGTTDDTLLKILETSGLVAGTDFFLGFSPERIDPGNKQFGIENVPKIVGGINEQSTELMAAFYESFVAKVHRVSSPRAAEMAKLLENTYRHVNIALVNEIAILCRDLGIDVWEVIDAAATKPFGFQPFYPGPGWGGHCIPVDPAYLSWSVRQMGSTARFVELAREFNERMPQYVVQRIGEALNEGGKSIKDSSVLVLGVAYKADVSDTRESPATDIIEKLQRSGAKVSFNDPLAGELRLSDGVMQGVELTEEAIEEADLVLVHTNHTDYNWQWIARHARCILDTRNALKGVQGNIIKL